MSQLLQGRIISTGYEIMVRASANFRLGIACGSLCERDKTPGRRIYWIQQEMHIRGRYMQPRTKFSPSTRDMPSRCILNRYETPSGGLSPFQLFGYRALESYFGSSCRLDPIYDETGPANDTFGNRILTLYSEFAYRSNPVPNVSIFTGCEGSPVVREGDDRRCEMPKRGFGSAIDTSAARSFS